ncbi:lipoprotein signal peptidase [Sphingobacterium faecium]|jgi:signal peptidase II|uniref:lipoprotein signal peptidase n=1 Tax=Sphingobacterium faecium TaxID=34087 RepID=UPI0005F2FE80|nr:lipoprotein signal peptidase [Sphingobacterium faecium]UXD68518.1 lipoprotein signal peptidase [Sphingobacterium faecium]WGQ16226.1 lipoprotein signal peptidase [Sphingobacterium faecium]SJN31208.1 Lipoprotein signal peptidase [Sphingobacterium faecium PCAi_F2.5]
MKGYTKPVILIILVLLIDQISKLWVKLNMTIGQSYEVIGKFVQIHFIENNGMAYGMEFGGEFGKLMLTLFRIVAVGAIGYGLHYMVQKKYNRGFILNIALIFAGALGNIIDSTFYGLIFSESTWYDKATLFPSGGGYATIFHGKVVDMLYFPLIEGTFPSWLPIWGGQEFLFFRPVFNIADSAISVGVILILLFQKKYFKEEKEEKTSIHSEIVED